jgi:anti-anti-sigma factor
MEIKIHTEGEFAELVLSGSLVATSAGELVGHVSALLGCGFKRIMIDMGDVEFMDSLGLRACIAMHKQAQKEEGKMIFCKPSRAVGRIFDITRANTKLNIANDPETGRESLMS